MPAELVDESAGGAGAASNPYASPFQSGGTRGGPAVDAYKRLTVPAVCLLVLSLLGAAFAVIGGAYWVPSIVVAEAPMAARRVAIQTVLFSIINVAFCVAVMLGAIAMLRGRPWWLAVAGSCAAVVPLCGPCFLPAIPFGIWALCLLLNGDVRASFR